MMIKNMKLKKVICIVASLLICMNATALATETQESQTETIVQSSTVQPKGRYL